MTWSGGQRSASSRRTSRPPTGDLYWADLDLDLDGAELQDLDLTGAAVRRISARRSKLHGDTKLAGLRVRETASFAGADFLGNLRCEEMMVERRTDLSGITVRDATSALGCALRGHTILSGARFQGPVDFTDTIFFDAVNLSAPHHGPARFDTTADFTRTCFTAAWLDRVQLHGDVHTAGARFVRTPATRETPRQLLDALRQGGAQTYARPTEKVDEAG
jgi:uncharacterized protein YjbI with pentapeptide repeats